MVTAEQLFEQAIIHWRDAKGRGTAFIPQPLNDKAMVLGILQRIYIRNPTQEVMIVVNTYNERIDLIQFLTKQGNEENDDEFKKLISSKKLKLVSANLLENNLEYFNIKYRYLIVYHVKDISKILSAMIEHAKFVCNVYNTLASDETRNILYLTCPLLPDFKQNEIDSIRRSTPVEEELIGVDFAENDATTYDRYTKYINESIAIFGSLEVMNTARLGDRSTNRSEMAVCYDIARENGWNERLDMSVGFNKQIDAMFNPNALNTRASDTYSYIHKRIDFCTDYNAKIDVILHLVKENVNKKILIINKRGEFASLVTAAINEQTEALCANYHDKVDNIPAVDINGQPVFYKSGVNKGKRRIMGAQAQRTLAAQQFNDGLINVLSTSGSPDKSLNVDVDMVIITSPMCDEIENYIYRLSSVNFVGCHIPLFTLYCKNSIEERKVLEKEQSKTHKIVNNTENEVYADKNIGTVIVN